RAIRRAAEGGGVRARRGRREQRAERAHPLPAQKARQRHRRDGKGPGLSPGNRRARICPTPGNRLVSLRLRLTLTLGSAFVLLWAVAATWMLMDVRNQMMLSQIGRAHV